MNANRSTLQWSLSAVMAAGSGAVSMTAQTLKTTGRGLDYVPTKRLSIFRVGLASLALVAGLAGCATPHQKAATQQKEDMLQAAGFRTISATTPGQQQMLRALPAGRVSAVQRKGQVYFVYPARAKNLLYVGTNAQYLAYQQAAQATQEDALVKQEVEAIKRSVSSPGWNTPWADWDSP